MNTLSLDLSNKDIANALKNNDTGDHCEFTVAGTLTKSDKVAIVKLDEVKYTGSSEGDSEPGEGSPAEEAQDASESAPKPPKKKMAPAVAQAQPSGMPGGY